MDTSTLIARLRSEDDAVPDVDVDRLVGNAARLGRRQVQRRRAVTGLVGGTAAMGVLGAALSLGPGPSLVVPSSPARPVDPGVSVPAKPAAPTSGQPSAAKPKPPTPAMVQAVLTSLLPPSQRVSSLSAGGRDLTITMVLSDSQGRAWAGGGLGSSAALPDCTSGNGCSSAPLADGVLDTYPDGQKVGDGTWYYFRRADGRYVWFGQRAAFEGNGPVTRPSVPLTDAQVRALLTSPRWDSLAAGCQQQPGGPC